MPPRRRNRQADLAYVRETLNPHAPPTAETRQEWADLGLQGEQARLDRYKQETEQRRTFARGIYQAIILWLIVVLGILILSGSKGVIFHGSPWAVDFAKFELSNSVLIALLTTTTGNIIGLGLVVFRSIFRHEKEQ